MNPIQQLAGQFLFWTQPTMFGAEYVLLDAEKIETLATLQWQSWTNRVLLTIGARTLNADRLGFFNLRIEIREGDSKEGALIGTYKPHWSGNGTLTLESGRQFEWKNANVWRTHWRWTTLDDGDLMRFSSDSKWSRLTRSEAKVELSGAVADFPDAELLVVLGWYLMLLKQREATAASGA